MKQIGRYEVIAELGRGGFGRVFRAHDPMMQRDVAIKVLTAMDDPSLPERFRREAGTTGQLQHRNIVTVFDYGEQDGQAYIVMELLEGRTLKDILDAKLPLSLYRKVNILTQIAEALHHAHQKGIIHRDIKPANIVLLIDGTVKLVDFGIARIMDSARTRHTMPGQLLGTVEYMSPEQLYGKDADPTAEVFSYGVVFYETLTGQNPFRAKEFTQSMQRLTTVEPVPVRQLYEESPEALESIARRCLVKNPANRYQTMGQVLGDLNPVFEEQRRIRAEARKTEMEPVAVGVAPARDALGAVASPAARRTDSTALLERDVRTALSTGQLQHAFGMLAQVDSAGRDSASFSRLLRNAGELNQLYMRATALSRRAPESIAARELTNACTTAAAAIAKEGDTDSVSLMLETLRRRLEVRENELAAAAPAHKSETTPPPIDPTAATAPLPPAPTSGTTQELPPGESLWSAVASVFRRLFSGRH